MTATDPLAIRSWSAITVPAAATVAADFLSPGPEYGLILWWGWDGPMSEAVIARDLDEIVARGVRCVMIEAGYGMAEPYLSPGWFELVRLAVEHARRRDMRVYLVDEGKYPSGFAGGKFSAERPDLRMQGVGIAERIPVAPGETLVRSLSPNVVGALAVNRADESSQVIDVQGGELRWTAPEGEWEVWLVDRGFRTSVTRAVSNPDRGKDATNSLCDYLNPEATRQFIAFTHEQYEAYLGETFGRTVLGFRGDEPDFAHLPWTPDLPVQFEQRKGYDVRPYLASFFAPQLTDLARRVKADYWDVWSELFGERFFRIQAEWCAARGLAYLVHLNHEDKMAALVHSEGDFFRAMRHVPVPGVDAIWNQVWPDRVADFAKLASSAAHLYGRPRAFSESFAAYRIRPTIEQAKWVIDYQFVRGINMLEVMFYPSSANPRQRSGWLSSEAFPALAEYVRRASFLLSVGRPAAQIALYYPTSSLWLGDERADERTWQIARQLLERRLDFDFVDEGSLSSLLKLEDGAFVNLSGQRYRAVIVPPVGVLSKSALARLRVFQAAGGRVIVLGDEPTLVVENSFLDASGPADLDWAIREPSGEWTPRVMAALPRPDVKMDKSCPSVKVLHRRWRDAELFFFFNEGDTEQSFQATLAGSGQVQVWDARASKINTLTEAAAEMGAVCVSLTLSRYESKFVLIGALP